MASPMDVEPSTTADDEPATVSPPPPDVMQLHEDISSRLNRFGFAGLPRVHLFKQPDKLQSLEQLSLDLDHLGTLQAKPFRSRVIDDNIAKVRGEINQTLGRLKTSGQSSGVSPADRELYEAAWKASYVKPDVFEAFKETVKTCANAAAESSYARIIPIIQSSGVGKSRMLDEVAKSVFALPMCLRSAEGNGYPFGDEAVVDFLWWRPKPDKTTILALLCGLFSHTLSVLQNSPSLKSPAIWRSHLQREDVRQEFYREVCDEAEKRARWVEAKSHDERVAALKSNLCHSLKQLSGVVEEGYVLVYIDEAHNLNRPGGTGGMVHHLMSAMADIHEMEGIALVLMSTTSQLSALAPGPTSPLLDIASLLFERVDVKTLIQPWTYFPLHVFPISPQDGSPWTPQHSRSFKASANLGRPLWSATLREKSPEELQKAEKRMKKVAFLKLNIMEGDNRNPLESKPREKKPIDNDPLGDEPLKAALVCRLAPGFERTAIGTSFAARLVARRMAVAHFVDQSCSFMAASYPVDPVLAWAAFQTIQLRSSEEVCTALSQMTEFGMIERCPRGELVTKLALMRAYDRALPKKHCTEGITDYATVSQIPHFSAVSLGELFRNLSGRDSIMNEFDMTGKKQLRELTACDLVLAQWIGCYGEEDTVDTELALHSLFTHCGLQMPFNMPGVDHMLVACRDANEPISKSNMVVIMLQSKNRKLAQAVDLPRPLIERFSAQGVPVIYILHEVAPKDPTFSMTNYHEQNAPKTLRSHGKSRKLAGDVWCFIMDGVNEDLLLPELVSQIVEGQSNLFTGRGNMSVPDIFRMQPLLTLKENLRPPMYEEASRCGLFGSVGTLAGSGEKKKKGAQGKKRKRKK